MSNDLLRAIGWVGVIPFFLLSSIICDKIDERYCRKVKKKMNKIGVVEQPSVPKTPEVKPMKKNQNRTNELKPCPFCGSERLFYARSFVGIYMVKCLECGAIVSFNGKEERAECIKAWNRREAE